MMASEGSPKGNARGGAGTDKFMNPMFNNAHPVESWRAPSRSRQQVRNVTTASSRAAKPQPRYRAGRIVGGVAAAVLVIAASVIAGFFIGRDTASPGSSVSQTDTDLTVSTGSRIQDAATQGSLVLTPELLSGTAQSPLERQATAANQADIADLLQTSVGSSKLQLDNPTVEVSEPDMAGNTRVHMTGDSSLHGVPTRVAGKVFYVDGQLRMVMEHYPKSSDFELHSIAAAAPGTHLPRITQGSTAFVVSNFDGHHELVGANAPRPSAQLQRGLNVVSSMRASDNLELHTLFATTAPVVVGRRLAGSRTQPITANAISALPQDVEQWFHGMEVHVEGLLRPHVNLSSTNIPSLLFNKNLAMHNVTLRTPAARGGAFDFSAKSTLSLHGCQPVSVDITGAVTNTSYKFRGALGDLPLGPASAGLVAKNVLVVASGARGPAVPNASVTYATSVFGELALSGVRASFAVALPMTPSNSGEVAVNVSDIHLGASVELQHVRLLLSEHLVAASANVTLATHSSDTPAMETAASLSFGAGKYAISADVADWSLPVGPAGIQLTQLHLAVAGPSSGGANTSPLADPEFSLDVTGRTTIEGIQFDASLHLPSPSTAATAAPLARAASNSSHVAMGNSTTNATTTPSAASAKPRGLTFDLKMSSPSTMTLAQAMSAIGSGATPLGHLPAASSVLNSLKDLSIQSLSMALTTAPLSLVVGGTIDAFSTPSVSFEFHAQRPGTTTWAFAVGVGLSSPFAFSDLVPADTGLDFLSFTSGTVVVSTSASGVNFTMAGPNGTRAALSLPSEGVALVAQLPFTQLSERLVSSGAWDHVKTVDVNGTFGATTSSLSLSAALPPQLPLTPDVTLTTGMVKLSSSEPRFVLDAAAAVSFSSEQRPLRCAMSGTLEDASFNLTASVSEWHIGAQDKGVNVSSASLRLDGRKSASSGNWSTTGRVAGNVTFGDMVMEGVLDLPVSRDHLDLQVPELQLNNDVRLSNIDVTVATSATGVRTFHLAGKANVSFANETLVFDANAVITGANISVTGDIPTWKLGGDNGLVCTGVKFAVAGTYSAQSGVQGLRGKLSGAVDFFGVSAAFEVPVPMAKSGELKLTVAHLDLGHHVQLSSVELVVRHTQPQYLLSADATIGTGLKNEDLALAVSGWLVPGTGNFTLAGSVADWAISSEFSISNLSVNVSGTRNAAGANGTALSGTLNGEMHLGAVNLAVEAKLPAASLTVSFPQLRIAPEVLLKNVAMTLTGSTPAFTYTATAVVTTHLPTPLEVSASGSVNGADLVLDGTLSSWTLDVGSDGFTVSNVTLHLEDTPTSGGFAGSLNGTLHFGSTLLDMAAAIPGPSDAGLVMRLSLQSGHTMSLAKAVTATAGGSAMGSASAPSGTLASVQDATMSHLTMYMSTKPAMFNLTARVSAFGLGSVDCAFVAAQSAADNNNKWAWAFGATLSNTFKVSDIDGGNTAFDFLPLSGGAVTIASFAHALDLGGNVGTVHTTDGVTLVAFVPLEHLAQNLQAASKWGTSGDARLNGSFTFSSHNLTLEGELPPNLPLGSRVTLNATVLIQEAEPRYALNASAHVTFHADVDPLWAAVDVWFDESGEWHIRGVAKHYAFHLGTELLKGSNVRVALRDGGGSEFSGTVAGIIGFKHPDVDMAFNFSVPSADNGKGGMSLNLALAPGDHITFGNLIKTSLGETSLTGLPSDFSSVMSTQLLSADVLLSTSPLQLTAEGTMSLFRIDEPLTVRLVVGQNTSGWSWGVGIGIAQPFTMGQVLARESNSKANDFQFGSGGLVVTNSADGFALDLGAGQQLVMSDGIALQGDMHMSQGPLATVQKWTDVDSLAMRASFKFGDDAFRIKAGINASDWTIGSHVDVSEAFLFMDIGGSTGFELGVGCDLGATLASGPSQQTLDFNGDMMITTHDIKFQAGMTTPWADVFGLPGITVNNTEIMLGISFTGVPDAFGLSGTVQIGNESGGATVYVDPTSPSAVALAGQLTELNLGDLLHDLSDGLVPEALAKTVLGIDLKDLALELNVGASALTFDGKTFKPGFSLGVKQFNMFGITGSLDLMLSFTNMFVNATVNPILVGSNGDIFTLSGVGCNASCPATMLLQVGEKYSPGGLQISGQASLLSAMELDAQVNISDSGIEVVLKYTDSLLDLDLMLNAPGLKKLEDFSLYAAVEPKVLDYIGNNVVGYVKKAKKAADAKIDAAKQEVTNWLQEKQPELDANKAKIANLTKQSEAQYSGAEQELLAKKQKLYAAQKQLNNLTNTINTYTSEKTTCEHWYDADCKAHNAWLDTKIAALWTEKHTESGVLDLAEDAVGAAEKVVNETSKLAANLHPEVLKLEAEDAALEAAYKAAQAGLSAAESLTNSVLDGIDFATTAATSLFNIENMWISAGSVASVKSGAQLSVGVAGVIVGDHFNWTLSVDFPPKLDNIMEACVSKAKGGFGL